MSADTARGFHIKIRRNLSAEHVGTDRRRCRSRDASMFAARVALPATPIKRTSKQTRHRQTASPITSAGASRF
jgi:hypothetical protein